MNSIEILTYNIHKGFSPGKILFQLHQMRQAITHLNPDILFLQEVQGEHRRQAKWRENWPMTSQFEFLAEELWPHYAYAKNAIYHAGHHGNAILSKYPIIQWENVSLSTVKRASRSLLHGRIHIPETQIYIHVICIHFGLFKNERSDQFQMLSQRIQDLVGEKEPLIIAGDFNDWRKTVETNLEKTLGLQEVFYTLEGQYAKTFPALRPTLQTDRIYFRGLKLEQGLRLDDKSWRKLSDHIPLYAKFSFE